jgi:WD40 repeat protein
MGVQTEDVAVDSIETQTSVASSVETQTPALGVALKRRGGDDGEDPTAAMASVGFVAFLRRASAMVQQQLEMAARSRAFNGVELSSSEGQLGGSAAACLYELRVAAAVDVSATESGRARSRAPQQCIPCTGVSWSSTGSVLAASLGRTDHAGWCCAGDDAHGGPVGLALWNVFGHRPSGAVAAAAAAGTEAGAWLEGGSGASNACEAHAAPAAAPSAAAVDVARPPDALHETSSCLMCVACHPSAPGMVAGGTYTGEVIVWDTGRDADDARVGTSSVGDYYHRDPVLRVEWVYDARERGHVLLSTSGCGRVLVWSIRNKLASPIAGYLLHPPRGGVGGSSAAPRRAPSGQLRSSAASTLLGGTALAALRDGTTARSPAFVVGTEGGGLFASELQKPSRASARSSSSSKDGDGAKSVALSKGAEVFFSRTAKAHRSALRAHVERWCAESGARSVRSSAIFESAPKIEALYSSATTAPCAAPHVGPVSAVACSRFVRDAVLSCGLDGRLVLRSISGGAAASAAAKARFAWEPARLGAPLLDVAWSPLLPLVFASAAEDGVVYVYDLGHSTARAWAALNAGSLAGAERRQPRRPRPRGAAAHGVAFNPRIDGMVAAAYRDGTIRVWRLPSGLSRGGQGKLQSLLQ